jgi:tetratricopeptide (TPR) repeat protein
MEDLEMAIQAARIEDDKTPKRHADRAQRLTKLGILLADRYSTTNAMDDLDEVIRVKRQSIDITPKALRQATHLSNLAGLLKHRYILTGKVFDLDEAIEMERSALDITPNSFGHVVILEELEDMLYSRYERALLLADIEGAMQADKGVDSSFKDPDQVDEVIDQESYFRNKALVDLEEVIQVSRLAVNLHSNDSAARSDWLNTLSVRYYDRYCATDAMDDLEEGIRSARQALDSAPEGTTPVSLLRNLSIYLGKRNIKTEERADIEEAVQLARQALGRASEKLNMYLASFADLLFRLYQTTGMFTDLDEAIQVARQAVNDTRQTSETRFENSGTRLENLDFLGHLLLDRYKKSGSMADLDESIQMASQQAHIILFSNRRQTSLGFRSLMASYWSEKTRTMADSALLAQAAQQRAIIPIGKGINQVGSLNKLGNRLSIRYSKTGKLEDLLEALQIKRLLIEMTPNNSDLADLSALLGKVYNQTQSPTAINEAIEISTQLVDKTRNDSDQATNLATLAVQLYQRYQISGNVAELDKAIEVRTQAIKVIPDGDQRKVEFLPELGALYYRKYCITRARGFLDKSIDISKEAANAMSEDHPERAKVLSNISYGLLQKYRGTNVLTDLEEAISLGREATEATSNGYLNREIVLDRLGIGLYQRYLRVGTMTDLEEAIRLGRQAMTSARKGPLLDYSVHYWIGLASMLCERHVRTGSKADFEEAIKLVREARTLEEKSRSYHSNRTISCCYLGLGCGWAFEFPDQDNAAGIIEHIRMTLEVTAENHPIKARYLSNLAFELNSTGSLVDLDEAIQLGRQAIDMTRKDYLDLPWHLCCLAIGLLHRFWKIERPDDLEDAISLSQRAVDTASIDHEGRPFYLVVLARALHSRYWATGRLSDLYECINLGLQAFSLSLGRSLEDYCNRSWCACNLAAWFGDKYLREGAMADFEQAIQYHRDSELALDELKNNTAALSARHQDVKASYYSMHLGTRKGATTRTTDNETIHIVPQDFPDCPTRLHYLGAEHFERFEKGAVQEGRGLKDLSIAAWLCERSVEAIPNGHLMKPVRLYCLGECYEAIYLENTNADIAEKHLNAEARNKNHLDNGINSFQEIVDAAPRNGLIWVSAFHRLGALYNERFRFTGDLGDLKMALQLYQDSVDGTPKNHPDRAARLEKLGSLKKDRFVIFGNMADIETAIQLFQEAVDITGRNSPLRANYSKSLGAAHHAKYDITKSLADLEVALQVYQDAVDTCLDGHILAATLGCLGQAYLEKYKIMEAETDFEGAIQTFQKALDSESQDSPNRAIRLVDLALCYSNGYIKVGTTAYINTAARLFQEAANATPADHPDHITTFSTLGYCYEVKYDATKSNSDLEAATASYSEAFWDSPGATIVQRLDVARNLVSTLILSKNWHEAWCIVCEAIPMIRAATPRFLDNSERQALLSQYSGFASDAAAVTLSVGREPIEAIQHLEEGRVIAAVALNELRASGSLLSSFHPKVGKEFLSLRDQLQTPLGRRMTSTELYEEGQSALHRVTRHLEASRKLDSLISDFRARTRSRIFPEAPDEIDHSLPTKGDPIVVINVSYRCDAFLFVKAELRVLPLPTLSREVIEKKAREGNFGRRSVLEWLWDNITGPILDALGFTEPSLQDHWPHVWWIPTGPLSRFPLHAAGRHTEWSNKTVIDRVMSSYGPSIRSILQGYKLRHQETNSAGKQALIVAMEDTPGSKPLPFATKEAAVIREVFCKSTSIEPIEPDRRKEDVLSHLRDCDIFHFAGHGYTDVKDPSNSHLRLEDWKDSPLRVADLLEINLHERPPFLAYLSACGTGRIEGKEYLDESIHLITACQLAGFRHVIGTLWEVRDEMCVDIAKITYEGIRDGGMTDESVCRGLHNAIRQLRDRWLSVPVETRRASRSIGKANKFLGEHDSGDRSVGYSDQRDDRLARDIISCDEEETELLHWVPYVHFGV